jgi:pimeloyl-ACP methyl ester carboxylesterase
MLHAETLVVSPTAPWLVFVNSLLTDTTLWSPVIPSFLSKGYNILIYDQRGHGRSSIPSPPLHTISELADDLVVLLEQLRIPLIHALVGVSQGGATALNFAIRHAAKTTHIIACDTQAVSPASNGPAWDARIELARTNGMEAFAAATARRWFPPGSKYHPDGGKKAHVVCNMITRTSFLGFKAGARTLQNYDLLQEGLLQSKVRTLLVAGEMDGVLPDKMKGLASEWVRQGGDVKFEAIEGSGHLPMLDKPERFLQIVISFLE